MFLSQQDSLKVSPPLSLDESECADSSGPPPAIFVPDLAKVTDHRVVAVAQAMGENLKQHHSIESLAHGVNLSVNQLEGLFKHELACSPLQYLMSLRLMQACVLLETTELRVGQIMRQVGFTQTGYFSSTFRAAFACTPKEYRVRHRQQMNAMSLAREKLI